MSRASRAIKKTGRILKWTFAALIAFVCGFLLWRILSAGDPDSIKRLTVNERIHVAYTDSGEDLAMFTQEQNSITRADNNAGYFAVTNHVFIPKANQVQLVFRYNNSTIRALKEDYQLEQTPSRDDELYDVTLVLAIDLTPNDTSDNAGNDPKSVRFVRVHATDAPTADKSTLYNYRRFVFDVGESGEDLSALLDSGLLLAVYADVYYVEDCDYDSTSPYGTLCLYDYLSQNVPVKLTSDDKRALAQFGN